MVKFIAAFAVTTTLVIAAGSAPAAAASQQGVAAGLAKNAAQATDMSAQRRWWRHRYARPWWGFRYRPYYAYRHYYRPYYAYAYPYRHRYWRRGPVFGFRFGPVGFGVW
jgi:hypothetical protein